MGRRQPLMQRLDLRPMPGDLVQGSLQIAGHLAPAQGGKLHRAVFGEHQQVRACSIGDPGGQLGLVIREAVEPVYGISGGGDLHRRRIQNCRVFSVSVASPRSFQEKRAVTPGSGSYPRLRQKSSNGR